MKSFKLGAADVRARVQALFSRPVKGYEVHQDRRRIVPLVAGGWAVVAGIFGLGATVAVVGSSYSGEGVYLKPHADKQGYEVAYVDSADKAPTVLAQVKLGANGCPVSFDTVNDADGRGVYRQELGFFGEGRFQDMRERFQAAATDADLCAKFKAAVNNEGAEPVGKMTSGSHVKFGGKRHYGRVPSF